MKHGVNILMVMKVIGWLLMMESAFMTIPLLTCVAYGETDFISFLVSIGITSIVGAGLTFGLPSGRKDMGKREGFLLTALVWIAFSLFGMIPFMIGSNPLSLSDAFFESMSGFTTTGVSVISSVESLGRGLLIWRCLMQWLGGMGIILFTLAVMPMLNHSGGMQMFNAEVTGITHDKIRPRISQTAKGLWGVYIILTVVLIGLLWLGPMTFYESICQGFSAISTGGFSTADDSIAHWNSSYIKIVLTVFMFLGGINFSLLYRAGLGDWKSALTNDIFKTYIYTILTVYAIFVVTICLRGQADSLSALTIDPMFQIVSVITSTGLSVCDYEIWGAFPLAILFILMFCGACAGSTSGGAKIDRLLYLFINSKNELYRCLHPRTMFSVRINGKTVAPEIVSKVIAFLGIYVILIISGGIALTAVGLPISDSFFSAFSCISNTGLGLGTTDIGCEFQSIPDIGKWILSALMLTGRLEIFTVLVLFTPGFWRK